jgi:hypothetical protein
MDREAAEKFAREYTACDVEVVPVQIVNGCTLAEL